MFHRPYRVIVSERGTGKIIHAQSTFTELQSAIDRAWVWVGRGHDVQIENKGMGRVVWRKYTTTPEGDEYILPF